MGLLMKFHLPYQNFSDLPQAYLVGGCVRDALLGITPLDYDIVVPDNPSHFSHLLAKRLKGKVIILAKDRFDVHRIISQSLDIDVTKAKDGNIESDLKSRDFTINAMAYDLKNKKIIDWVNGREDLKRRRVKVVSPEAFKSDPARLVRAFRMAAKLTFQIEPQTLEMINKYSNLIQKTAGERIWSELNKIIACPDSAPLLKDMAGSGLLFSIIPELRELKGCAQNQFHTADVFTHTISAYQALEQILNRPGQEFSRSSTDIISNMEMEIRVILKLAILLHDIGKPASRSRDPKGNLHFYGHAGKSAVMAQTICKRLRMPNRYSSQVLSIIQNHQRPLSLYLAQKDRTLRPKPLGRFFRQCARHTPYILLHAMADDMGKGSRVQDETDIKVAFYKEIMETYFENCKASCASPLIGGNDLQERFNIPPSPLMGKILKSIQELQLAGAITKREEALQWVADYLKRNPTGDL